MILLSNLIKSSNYVPVDDKKKIEAMLVAVEPAIDEQPGDANEAQDERLVEAEQLSRQMLDDAQQAAQDIVRQAKEQASVLAEQAKQEAQAWWDEQRSRDEQASADAAQAGREQGYVVGKTEAERDVKQQYESMLEEARQVLEQAHALARQTVSEAEPFLLELSCSIAAKIVGRSIELEQDWIVDMVAAALRRCNDKSTIALCVAPAHFAYIQSVRQELENHIDAQAELRIYPDASVGDGGCVIKTSFGTIDARVDTQLLEIKQALLDLVKRGDAVDDQQA